jgi:hypothetical protein
MLSDFKARLTRVVAAQGCIDVKQRSSDGVLVRRCQVAQLVFDWRVELSLFVTQVQHGCDSRLAKARSHSDVMLESVCGGTQLRWHDCDRWVSLLKRHCKTHTG